MIVDLPPLREVIARYGLKAEKSLGQNFLLDGQLLDRIAAIPGDLRDKPVYEVGPGPGGLTRALLKAGALVTVVERDRRCIPALRELEAIFSDGSGSLKVTHLQSRSRTSYLRVELSFPTFLTMSAPHCSSNGLPSGTGLPVGQA